MNTIEITEKELLEKLPSGWNEITLSDFINKILNVEISEGGILDSYENAIKVASSYLDFSIDIIERFPMPTIVKIHKKLSFLSKKPTPLKKPKWKPINNIEEYDYDTFVTFIKVNEQINKGDYSNFHLILQKATKDPLTKDQCDKMPMDEVETLFFLLRKTLMKYLKSSNHSLLMKLQQVLGREGIKTLFRKTSKNTKNNTKKNLDGTS